MNLKKTILFNKIKNISIEDSIVKINDTNEIENKFSVMLIQKIYLKAHKQNKYLFYFILITITTAIVMFFASLKLALGIVAMFIVAMFIAKFLLNKKKYILYIKSKEKNTIYSIPFNTKRKEEILKVIWEIKKQQFEATAATN